ncbi:hypothetical protein BP5796_03359 [Coleophoma crateriformis]|uniref:Uncharacterized protein n=1 Tax=Coleophoma crateriformis TaxID=565419 RepID=A0A3D8SMX2_9HELO|nr:hypothetical protein BP5796_03359 [Coleophoma crateriformis]
MPVKDGIVATVNDAIYMSEVSINVTALPLLLHHSRDSILGASRLVRASSFENKDALAHAYDELTAGIETLRKQLTSYTIGVPDLINTIDRQLSDALSNIRAVHTPYLDALQRITILSLIGSTSLMFYWSLPIYPRRRWPIVMVLALSTLSALAYCKISLVEGECLTALCKHVTSVPVPVPMFLYSKRIHYRYEEAAISLWQFVFETHRKMRALSEITLRGITAAEAVEKHFDIVNVLIKVEDCTAWNLYCWIGDDISVNQRREQEVSLTIDLNQLASLTHMSTTAYQSFRNAQWTLDMWQRRLEPMIETLREFRNPVGRYTYSRDDEYLWHQLIRDVEQLRPILRALHEAYENQKLKNVASQKFWDNRSYECRLRQDDMAREGKRVDMIDCMLDGLQVGFM